MTLEGWGAIFFWVFAIAALMMGLLTVLARNAVHSAMFLISTLVSIAALFILLGAEFVAGAQILVYVGGVMVLFLFVIMLVNVGAEERGNENIFNPTPQVTAALIFSGLLALGLVMVINQGWQGLRERGGNRPEMVEARRLAQERDLPRFRHRDDENHKRYGAHREQSLSLRLSALRDCERAPFGRHHRLRDAGAHHEAGSGCRRFGPGHQT